MLTIQASNATRKLLPVLFGLMALFWGAVVGFAAMVGLIFPLMALAVAGVLVTGLIFIAVALNWQVPRVFFILIFVLYFVYYIVQMHLRIPLYSVMELSILIAGLWGVKRFVNAIGQSGLAIASFFAFGGFLLMALASTFVEGNFIGRAAVFQFVSDWKLPLVLAFGAYFSNKINVQELLDRSLPFIIVVLLAFLFLQWGAPGIYKVVMHLYFREGGGVGYLPAPGLSLFLHPSILAAASAALAIYTFTQWRVLGKQSGYAWLKSAALTFLLFASNQRQEIFAFMLVISTIYVLARREGTGKRLFYSGLLLAGLIALFLTIFGKTFGPEASEWGIHTYHGATHPRALLYQGAEDLARSYFPLGSGLGTFGGVGASKYDLTLYYRLGFSQQWWWPHHEDYLLDTFWPNSIAESGIIGAALLLIHFILFSLYLYYKAAKSPTLEIRMAWLFAAGTFTWVLFNSPTSPAFQEIMLLYFPGIFFGNAIAKAAKI